LAKNVVFGTITYTLPAPTGGVAVVVFTEYVSLPLKEKAPLAVNVQVFLFPILGKNVKPGAGCV
jgi:hypothetical protein